MIKQKKDAGIIWNKNKKTTREKLAIQLEEINQKVLATEGRLKRYRQRVKQYRQNTTFQNNERKFHQQLGDCNKRNNNQMQKKPNDFGPRYGNQKNITKMLNG